MLFDKIFVFTERFKRCLFWGGFFIISTIPHPSPSYFNYTPLLPNCQFTKTTTKLPNVSKNKNKKSYLLISMTYKKSLNFYELSTVNPQRIFLKLKYWALLHIQALLC